MRGVPAIGTAGRQPFRYPMTSIAMPLHDMTDPLRQMIASRHHNASARPVTLVLLVDQAALAGAKALSRLTRIWKTCNLLNPAAPILDGASPLALNLEGWRDCEEGHAVFATLLDHRRWSCGMSIIETTLPFDAAVQALSRRCHAVLPDDYRVVLRYFDTRILAVLWDTLTVPQRDEWARFARLWLHLSRDGEWQPLNLPERCDGQGAACIDGDESLRLSVEQQAALMEAAESDVVIDQLRSQGCAALFDLTPPQQYRCVQPLVDQARSLGIESTAKTVNFCRIALAYDKSPDLRKQWQERINKACEAGAAGLDELLATVIP